VAAEIIHDDDVAGFEEWNELLFDIGAEAFAVDWAVEDARRRELVAAQGKNGRSGLAGARGGQCTDGQRSRRRTPQISRSPAGHRRGAAGDCARPRCRHPRGHDLQRSRAPWTSTAGSTSRATPTATRARPAESLGKCNPSKPSYRDAGILASAARTCAADHTPPRGAEIPRSFNSLAIERSEFAPAVRMSSMIGARSAARDFAASDLARRALAQSAAVPARPREPPSRLPRALAAARAERVRSEINFASCSAMEAIM
jgi:hypothetical protein